MRIDTATQSLFEQWRAVRYSETQRFQLAAHYLEFIDTKTGEVLTTSVDFMQRDIALSRSYHDAASKAKNVDESGSEGPLFAIKSNNERYVMGEGPGPITFTTESEAQRVADDLNKEYPHRYSVFLYAKRVEIADEDEAGLA